MTYKPTRLSAEAFDELRVIVESEIKEHMTDEAIEEMGINLLKLFAVLLPPEVKPIGNQPTEQEQKALAFLQDEISQGRSASIRDLCKAIGFRSSRSGFRLLNVLILKEWVHRDDKGALRMLE